MTVLYILLTAIAAAVVAVCSWACRIAWAEWHGMRAEESAMEDWPGDANDDTNPAGGAPTLAGLVGSMPGMTGGRDPREWLDAKRLTVGDVDLLVAALRVAMAWHDGDAAGSDVDRAEELAGCRRVLARWQEARTDHA